MPKRMILPIAFIIMTLFFIVKGFYGRFQDKQGEEEQRQAESIKNMEEEREYQEKLQVCITQQQDYHDALEAKGELLTEENGILVDNSFKLLSDECKMMIIRSEREAGVQASKQ